MRVLVTGGAGFIGSHVVEAYLRAGHEVWVLDDLSRGSRANVPARARFVRMDLRSPDLADLLAEAEFDCVNHHAAQIDVRLSVADPAGDARLNILGTLNLLEAVRRRRVPRVIFASTGGAIYAPQGPFPAGEQHPTVPLSPYGVSKLSVEHYLEYYRRVHGLRCVVLRYANVYGPRQDPAGEAGVVAIFCRRILTGEPLVIYGDGEQTRDYVYVGDVARANLLALEHLAAGRTGSGGVFNIGTGLETSVNALAAMLLHAADADSPVTHRPARPGEVQRSALDPARARDGLGWIPRMSLSRGLELTLAWVRESHGLPRVAAGSTAGTLGPAWPRG